MSPAGPPQPADGGTGISGGQTETAGVAVGAVGSTALEASCSREAGTPAHASDEGESEPDSATEVRYQQQPVPGFEASASDCLNSALQIALSLNHTSLSSDHLMLALTMDPNARKHLERVGDIGLMREAAMLRLGKMNWKFVRRDGEGARFPLPTSDFDEIRKTASQMAVERDQKVAIADLINAFPKEDEQLTYGRRETVDAVPAVIERIETGLVPRVADFISKLETQFQETAERQLSNLLQSLGESQTQQIVERQQIMLEDISRKFQERQLASLEDISRQFQQHLKSELESVLIQLKSRLNAEAPEMPVTKAPSPPTGTTTPPPATSDGNGSRNRSGGYWGWIGLA